MRKIAATVLGAAQFKYAIFGNQNMTIWFFARPSLLCRYYSSYASRIIFARSNVCIQGLLSEMQITVNRAGSHCGMEVCLCESKFTWRFRRSWKCIPIGPGDLVLISCLKRRHRKKNTRDGDMLRVWLRNCRGREPSSEKMVVLPFRTEACLALGMYMWCGRLEEIRLVQSMGELNVS